ncbi:MAG: hypothetical protein LIP10_03580 [Clostridiales bacterium]|nr:hypothetical protein [Clostridiales bacterium]
MATMALILGKDLCHTGIYEFYNMLAKLSGVEITDSTRFDCRKVCVTPAVQDEIFSYYRDKGSNDAEIGALWLQLGPKANVTALNPNGLTFNYIAIAEDGFITDKDDGEEEELSYRRASRSYGYR